MNSLALSVESRPGAQWAIQKLERSLGVQHVIAQFCTEARELILRSRSDGNFRNSFMAATQFHGSHTFFHLLPALWGYLEASISGVKVNAQASDMARGEAKQMHKSGTAHLENFKTPGITFAR